MSILPDSAMHHTDSLRREINRLYCHDLQEYKANSFDMMESDEFLTFSYALPEHLQEYIHPRLSSARLHCHSGILSVSFPKSPLQTETNNGSKESKQQQR